MTEQTPTPADPPRDETPRSEPARASEQPFPPAIPVAELVPQAAADDAGPRLPQRTLDECDLGGRPVQRRVFMPAFLFLTTCFTVFCAGVYEWRPSVLDDRFSQLLAMHWKQGLAYMACCMAMLLAHEMGHFLMAIRYRISASYPFFLPVPITAIGTMGAVIRMDGLRANRRQLFDIGLAGPLAGLVLTIPLVCLGIWTAKLAPARPAAERIETDSGDESSQNFHYGRPLLVRLLQPVLRPDLPPDAELERNALYMAGWVGMLITGLNMLPISQLDGGHVIYGLLGRRSRWFARATLLGVIVYILVGEYYNWVPMIVLVTLLGVDHPPSYDDRVRIGPLRWALGAASLAIPILCFAPVPFGPN